MLLILSCLTSCPGDSVESSTRLIHHVIRLMHALLILRASMRVRTHRDGNVHVESSQGTDFGTPVSAVKMLRVVTSASPSPFVVSRFGDELLFYVTY